MTELIRVEKAATRQDAERRERRLNTLGYEVHIYAGPDVTTAELKLDARDVLRATSEDVVFSSAPFVVVAIREAPP